MAPQPKLKAADEAPEAPQAPPKTLGAALLQAQRDVGSVAKGSKNEYDHYAYTSADQMVAACRDALLDNGLLLSRTGHRFADASPFEAPILISMFRLEYPDTTEERLYEFGWPVVGNPKRLAAVDKAVAGALTTSLGYFERDLLNVPRADPNEMDRRDDVDAPPPPAKATDESRTLQAEVAAKAGLLKGEKFIKIASDALTRAGHNVKLLRQTVDWLDRRIAEEDADRILKAGKPDALPGKRETVLVDPETGEALEPDMDPEDPRFGLGKGEDGP